MKPQCDSQFAVWARTSAEDTSPTTSGRSSRVMNSVPIRPITRVAVLAPTFQIAPRAAVRARDTIPRARARRAHGTTVPRW
ncbi:MAG: hypothetical protein E6J91_41645 [Deltaproteobacteria bacterium]|nr:MAG: hypothetical protein E6J91_41645 [Deltaproteobacteria bacterium]